MKHSKFIMANEPISADYFINPSHGSLPVYVSPSFVRATTRKNVTLAMNTNKTVELLMRRFQFGPCLIKGKWKISFSQNFFFKIDSSLNSYFLFFYFIIYYT
jgi:hypothetical protein